MSNEELAIQIQKGNTGLTGALYEQVKNLIRQIAGRYYTGHRELCNRAGVTFDDLLQEGYFAFLDALRAYDGDSGCTFNSYLKYPIKNRFNAAVGIRSKKRNPLNAAISLDEPAGMEDSFPSLGDSIKDPDAETAYEDAEESIFTLQLHGALSECLDTLEEQQQYIIVSRYYRGKTYRELANGAGLSIERIRQIETKGLRKLRTGKCARRLRPFMRELISAYRGVGFQPFYHTGISVEQRILEWKEHSRAEGFTE